jgi:hypothetical protein
MKNYFFTLLAAFAVQMTHAETPLAAIPPIQQGKGHRFACTDYLQGKVFIVSAAGKVEWEYQTTTACNDLWVLPNGNLLFSTDHAVKEVARDKKVVWSYASKSEVHTCQRLANGNTLVGECNTGRLLEVTATGEIAKEVRLLPEGKDGGHMYMRTARRLKNGHYLVCHTGDEVVKEYDSQGKILDTIPAAGGPHSAVRLANGHTLISCGESKGGSRVFETDKKGVTVWEVKNGDLPGISLKYMAGLQRLPNGNTVMANWVGHNHFGEAPHIIEVTRAKKVVWTFADHQTMRTIANMQILDVPGDVTQGEIAH